MAERNFVRRNMRFWPISRTGASERSICNALAAPIARALLDQLAPGRRETLAGPYAEMHHALLRDTPALAAEAILSTAGEGA